MTMLTLRTSLCLLQRVVNKYFNSQNLSCSSCINFWPYFVNISFMNKRRFSSLSYLIRLEDFSLTALHKSNYLVFLLSYPIRLGVFLLSDQAGFPPQSSTGLGDFLLYYKSKYHRTFERSSHLRGKAIVMLTIT